MRADDGPSAQLQRQSVPFTGMQNASQYQQHDPASSRGTEGAAQQPSVSQEAPAAGNITSSSAQNMSVLDRRSAGTVSSRDADSPPQSSRSQQVCPSAWTQVLLPDLFPACLGSLPVAMCLALRVY